MTRAHWSNRFTFVLAAVGSAVGLGNIWKFPYITGMNGGGAFVLIYLACIAAVGLPVFIAELYVGQKAQTNAVAAFEVLKKPGTPWRWAGWLGVLSAFFILSFYSVVGGWVIDFEIMSLFNEFSGHSDQEIQGFLGALLANPGRQILWHFLFMSLTVGMVLSGVKEGIEKWNRILMPMFFVILLLLLVRALFLPGFGEAVAFLFRPDVSKLSAQGILEAVGHSFFTLSLGMGAMMTYGSYLSEKENLIRTSLIIAFFDTLVALIAGIVIFSVVFSNGLEAGAGPTLMFQTLPTLLAKMSGGYFFSLAFFFLVGVAALTSAVSLIEVAIAYFVESRNADRKKVTLLIGAAIFVLGIPSALSTNVLADTHVAFGLTFFDFLDKLTSNYFLPLGGLALSLFYGWVLGPKAVAATLQEASAKAWLAQGLLWSSRVLAPVAILIMILNTLRG